MSDKKSLQLEVLLVEDKPADVRLLREAFRNVNESAHLLVAADGVEAMAFLRREGEHVGAPRPDLILLDLNMPKLDGREVLALIKQDKSLKRIPLVILTASAAENDISICYQLHANCFLNKPAHWDAFHDLVKAINAIWLSRVRLPRQRENA